eukprot:gene4956-8550_t
MSQQVKKKKKEVSLNHLTNFRIDDKSDVISELEIKQNRKKYQKYVVPFNRDQFVLSNFQFIVRPPSQINNENMSQYYQTSLKPDSLVDWSTVEMVNFKTTEEEITCPICLEIPFAPQITKCGHVFCSHCILQYLTFDNSYKFKKCPLCKDSVYFTELKSVNIEYVCKYQIGHTIDLFLLQRPRNSLFPHKKTNNSPNLSHVFPLNIDQNGKYSRYNITFDITGILNRELSDLKVALSENYSEENASFILLAEDRIKTRQKDWNEWKKLHIVSEEEEDLKVLKKKIESKFEDPFGSDSTNQTIQQLKKLQLQNENKKEISDFFFYCSDDQLIFLIPLNIKMLLFEFGSFDKLPPMITAKILEIEKQKMSEDIRRYFKYLSYIPLGADIQFIEIDLSNIVSKKTMKNFQKEISIRRSKRQKKVDEEKRVNEEIEKKQTEELQKRLLENSKYQYQTNDFPSIKDSKEEFIKDTIVTLQSVPEGDWNKHKSTKKKKKKEDFPTLGVTPKPIMQISEPTQKKKPKKKKNEFPTLGGSQTTSSTTQNAWGSN